MIIHSASFVSSSTSVKQCPRTAKPEFGFIGRSNVGKSSLVNLLTGNTRLAKISGNPGKTRTINHFLVNESWYLVDLPGYGYARVATAERGKWVRSTEEYILKGNSCLPFVLLVPRNQPQKSDLQFMEFLEGTECHCRVFTKSDKLSVLVLKKA
jgi:GTP-binding protein